MIWKSSRLFIRSRGQGKNRHVEKVLRETWWLLGIIPLYSRDSIQESNL